jgi:DNA-binding transcriptional LysR family regulator
MNQNNDYIDLNLLRVFFAIWDLRSLTAAGDRLGLTQPAISHALRRLRERFNDPLFVRSANRMLPTEAAIRLHRPLDEAFAIISRALHEQVIFDPRFTERRFRIAMSDIAEVYALPVLLAALSRNAPLARIDVVPLHPESGAAVMRSGEVDLSVGHMNDPEQECSATDLFQDRFVCMVRARHPIVRTRLTEKSFGNLRFFFARLSNPTLQIVEKWLVESHAQSQIGARGHFTLAPEVVRNSDLAAIFPERLALRLHRAKDFRLFDLPLSLPPIEVKVRTHVRFAADSGIRWLCETVAKVIKEAH